MKSFKEYILEHDGEYMTDAQKEKAEEGKSTPPWYKGEMKDGKYVPTTRAKVERKRKDYDKSH